MLPCPIFDAARYGLPAGAVAGLALLAGGCASPGPETVQVIPVEETTRVEQRFSDPDRPDEASTGADYRVALPPEALRDGRPSVHVVVKGDTLWDISGRFLAEPWMWPQIWDYNPQIENPHLIYPGDRIALEYVDGQPTLVISRAGEAGGGRTPSGGSVKLSPRVRSESLDRAIPTIPGEAIRHFLVHPRVVSLDVLEEAPYILGNFDQRLISASGHQVFARGEVPGGQTRFGVYRRHKPLIDPGTDELLGYEVQHVAEAKLLNRGDPATLVITGNRMETMAGDLLLPMRHDNTAHRYLPRMPQIRGKGRVVSLVNAISQAGRDQVVVLNVGERSGVAVGDVLAIESRGGSMVDVRSARPHERVTLPNVRTGVVMVFETFDKVSYALVMESTRPVSVDDIVTGI